LLSIYFVCLIFSENLGEVFIGHTYRSAAFLLLATGVLLVIFSRIVSSFGKAAFVTGSLIALLFVIPYLEGLLPHAITQQRVLLTVAEVGAYFVIVMLAFHKVEDWRKINKAFNVMTGTMLFLVLFRIGSYGYLEGGFIIKPIPERRQVSAEGFSKPDGELPNIYYLMVDGYARADALQDYYGYDNSEFIGFLEGAGFQVAHSSVANYNLTVLAIAIVLNFEYVTTQEVFAEIDLSGWHPTIDKIFNNRVATVLAEQGYEIVTVRSDDYMVVSDALDLQLNNGQPIISQFEIALLYTTLIPRVFSHYSKGLIRALLNDRERVDYVIDEISRQSERDGPMLLLAHIMAPHQPFIYDRDGGNPKINRGQFSQDEYFGIVANAYADQVHHLNRLLRNTIENILENSSTPPIIILQSDHGLRLSWQKRRDGVLDRAELQDMCLREQVTNLNAMYLPGENGRAVFYDSISPVNTFRLIFDAYFGSDLGMLDDRTFFSTLGSDDMPTSLIEVTGLQETCNPQWEERFQEFQ